MVLNIENEKEWEEFVNTLQEPLCGNHYFSLILKMSDPSRVRQAKDENEIQQAALRSYKKKKIDASARPNCNKVKIPESGAPNERALLIQAIVHEHEEGDHSQCYKPQNWSNSFQVTLDRAWVWADIMVSY